MFWWSVKAHKYRQVPIAPMVIVFKIIALNAVNNLPPNIVV